MHKNIELTGRAVGEFARARAGDHPGGPLGILMTPEYVELRAELIGALRPHPAARQAVGEVLAAVEGQVPHFAGPARVEGKASAERMAKTR